MASLGISKIPWAAVYSLCAPNTGESVQSKKAEDDLLDQLREMKSKYSEQDTQLEEQRRRIGQLEHEKDQLEGAFACDYEPCLA